MTRQEPLFLVWLFYARIKEEKMVIRNYKYSPEDVDCRYCTESEDGCCKLHSCPWLKERIEAGVVSYHEAVKESFSEQSPLSRRINIVFSFFDKSFWKDNDHYQRFREADAALGFYKRRNTSEYYAALFLISADRDLLRRTMNCITKNGIDFSHANLHDISPENYALYKIAKGLYTESAEVSLDELADPELVSSESFYLVINAMLISRYGLSALSLKSEDSRSGSI